MSELQRTKELIEHLRRRHPSWPSGKTEWLARKITMSPGAGE